MCLLYGEKKAVLLSFFITGKDGVNSVLLNHRFASSENGKAVKFIVHLNSFLQNGIDKLPEAVFQKFILRKCQEVAQEPAFGFGQGKQ